jgi:hypothetical protein
VSQPTTKNIAEINKLADDIRREVVESLMAIDPAVFRVWKLSVYLKPNEVQCVPELNRIGATGRNN